jgi:hypothetical protein
VAYEDTVTDVGLMTEVVQVSEGATPPPLNAADLTTRSASIFCLTLAAGSEGVSHYGGCHDGEI